MTAISPLPRKKYTVILADPPWHYNDKAHAGQRGVEYKYSVLTDNDICALPIAEISADNAALFLWATSPKLPIALRVLSAWGFTYKTIAFMWTKTSANGKLAWGMGNWTRANGEIVLLGIKGRPQRLSAAVHSSIIAPRGEHSRKPDEVRDRIVQLLGDVPRVELFARGTVPDGWDGWGDQYIAEEHECLV